MGYDIVVQKTAILVYDIVAKTYHVAVLAYDIGTNTVGQNYYVPTMS